MLAALSQRKVAQGLSGLLHPLLLPIYLTLIAMYAPAVAPTIDPRIKLAYMLIVSFSCSLLPLSILLVLERLGKITSVDLHQRQERFLPMLIIMLCFFLCIILLQHYKAPSLLVISMQGVALAIMFVSSISLVWKISAHLTGMGGALGVSLLFALIYRIDLSYIAIIISLLSGLLAWARLTLKHHTLKQVSYGFLLGFSAVIVTYIWHAYF